ncbi:hypothetical protein NAEGRDRAFT_78069 [Naegleria gruberi]|uniref:Uncharacterized protein n=1 Tax=Naegleria gruberi TaxID=5762 RepID=D2V0S5_NAEGR|nr:uncharacterized protein NAEGRDRAFT_78069 [Naegleria gruberi]EFC49565.1 hypothetical protein NAEGRDRAFT_78069 [Naegleria gruberi]|eukprot:XP_002682309.1 hypothetical protein NAEGRDRAFT_78069 [Naegleria gruberi strain NEG-M]
MVNQKKVEYNERGQRIEKSLKYFVIEERRKREKEEDDPLEGIMEESLFINSQSGMELLSQYCLPTPKSLNNQLIVENYDHHLIDLNSMLLVKYEDMNDLQSRLDDITTSMKTLSFEKDVPGEEEFPTQFDGVNFEISTQLKKYKSNFENKRLSKFLSCEKNQKTIFDFIKPSHKRKPDEPKLSEEQSNFKKQKLISEYTCHQSGEEMFEILERSIERKKKQHQGHSEKQVEEQHLVVVLEESPDVSSYSSKNQPSSLKPQEPSASIQSNSKAKQLESKPSEETPIETKPKTYMERIRDHAKLFHSKHIPKSTLTIKKKPEKQKTRDILKEEDDFSIPQRCPVLSDILMLCMSSAPPSSREELCRLHKDRLDHCLDHEMRIEFERQIHSNCSTQFRTLTSGKLEKNLAYNELINCLREQITKPTSIII